MRVDKIRLVLHVLCFSVFKRDRITKQSSTRPTQHDHADLSCTAPPTRKTEMEPFPKSEDECLSSGAPPPPPASWPAPSTMGTFSRNSRMSPEASTRTAVCSSQTLDGFDDELEVVLDTGTSFFVRVAGRELASTNGVAVVLHGVRLEPMHRTVQINKEYIISLYVVPGVDYNTNPSYQQSAYKIPGDKYYGIDIYS